MSDVKEIIARRAARELHDGEIGRASCRERV